MKHLLAITVFIIFQFHSSIAQTCKGSSLNLLPHNTDCSRYFVCLHLKKFERKCAPGLLFDRQTSQCTLPNNAYCELSCPKVFNPRELIYLPNFSICSKFYICDRGHPISRSCASGLVFDSGNNRCDFPDNVNCERGNGNVIGAPTEKPPIFPDPGENTSEEIDQPSTEETTTLIKFPDPGEGSRESEETTEAIETTTSNPNEIDCPLVIGPVYLPHSIYCFKYFKCYYGIGYLQECAQGLQFDHIKNYCVADAECYGSSKRLQ